MMRIHGQRSVAAYLCPTCAPPALGAALLGQHARGVVSLALRTSHGRGA
jgi:hypothetical protein